MYSKYQPLSNYFTVLLYFLYTVEFTEAQAKSLDFWVIYCNLKRLISVGTSLNDISILFDGEFKIQLQQHRMNGRDET